MPNKIHKKMSEVPIILVLCCLRGIIAATQSWAKEWIPFPFLLTQFAFATVDVRQQQSHYLIDLNMEAAVLNKDELHTRAGNVCEICGGTDDLDRVEITAEDAALLCGICAEITPAPAGHWRALEGAAWSIEPAVQIAVWRKLNNLSEAWATDAQSNMMMEPDVAARAAAIPIVHCDAHGAVLSSGDTVVLIKDLPVKGAGFTAKRGTAVRSISLVADNAGHIEGRVENQRIVILTEFVKKK
jgi:protein PhnA